MYTDLLPEAIGLMLTPAVVGCILLLQSARPDGNVAAFALSFLVMYGAISLMVLAIDDSVEPTDDTSNAQAL